MEYAVHPVFKLRMPTHCEGVDPGILDPRSSWRDKDAYDRAAKKLRDMFRENFEKGGYDRIGIDPLG